MLDDNRVVRRTQHRRSRLASEFKEQPNQFNRVRPIEACRRLVGEEGRQSDCERAWTATRVCSAGRQTRDSLRHPIAKPDGYQRIGGAAALRVVATNRKGRIHILVGARKRDEHRFLCDERDVLPTELGPRLLPASLEGASWVGDLARGGKIEACQEVKKRRLSRPRRSYNRMKYTGFEARVKTFENRRRAHSPRFRDAAQDSDGSKG